MQVIIQRTNFLHQEIVQWNVNSNKIKKGKENPLKRIPFRIKIKIKKVNKLFESNPNQIF